MTSAPALRIREQGLVTPIYTKLPDATVEKGKVVGLPVGTLSVVIDASLNEITGPVVDTLDIVGDPKYNEVLGPPKAVGHVTVPEIVALDMIYYSPIFVKYYLLNIITTI